MITSSSPLPFTTAAPWRSASFATLVGLPRRLRSVPARSNAAPCRACCRWRCLGPATAHEVRRREHVTLSDHAGKPRDPHPRGTRRGPRAQRDPPRESPGGTDRSYPREPCRPPWPRQHRAPTPSALSPRCRSPSGLRRRCPCPALRRGRGPLRLHGGVTLLTVRLVPVAGEQLLSSGRTSGDRLGATRIAPGARQRLHVSFSDAPPRSFR